MTESAIAKDHLEQNKYVVNHLHLLQKYDNHWRNLEPVDLPPSTKQKVLVFDIDETMVHTIDESDSLKMKGSIKLMIPSSQVPGEFIEVLLNVRPHLLECLYQLKQHYQIISFTASEQKYADNIFNFMDPTDCNFEAIL